MTDLPVKKPRGFAAMDPAIVREIARKGGKAAHEKGTAHEFSTDEAKVAGRKGGIASHDALRRRKEASAGIIDAEFEDSEPEKA